MSEPSGNSDEDFRSTRFFRKLAAWVAALTAIVVALVGLRTAVVEFWPKQSSESGPANLNGSAALYASAIPEVGPSSSPSPTESLQAKVPPSPPTPTPTVTVLPTSYEKPGGFLAKAGNSWVETDSRNAVSFEFKQVSRRNGMTIVYDETRDVYMRWPNDGGQVQWSNSNPQVWSDLYIVTPVDSDDR
jgi:hypothetical protein